MELIKQRFKAFITASKVHLFEELENTTPVSSDFYFEVTSKTAGEDYAYLLNSGRLRKFLGERVARKLRTASFYVPNEEWEDTIEVARKDVADDATGKYEAAVRSVGANVKLLGDDQLFEVLLPQGETALALDGQNFFDTDHSYEKNGVAKTQSNLKTGRALNATNFAASLTDLKNLRDNAGRFVNRSANAKIKMIVPSQLENAANEIVANAQLANGATNPNYQKAEVVVADFDDATSWYLVNTGGSGAQKPFVKQTREFEPLTDTLDGDKDFHNRIYYVGTYWRGAFGYALYQYALKSKA